MCGGAADDQGGRKLPGRCGQARTGCRRRHHIGASLRSPGIKIGRAFEDNALSSLRESAAFVATARGPKFLTTVSRAAGLTRLRSRVVRTHSNKETRIVTRRYVEYLKHWRGTLGRLEIRNLNMVYQINFIAVGSLVTYFSASSVSAADLFQSHNITDYQGIIVQNGEKSSSIKFPRSSGGITQIGIERRDTPTNSYITVVTASGQTSDDAAMAAATLQTFTNMDQQASFVDAGSITFAYNQTKPNYVISELERTKLISAAEAETARMALHSLESRIDQGQR
jgi:hypothetical protein